jgi:hypothetical protein
MSAHADAARAGRSVHADRVAAALMHREFRRHLRRNLKSTLTMQMNSRPVTALSHGTPTGYRTPREAEADPVKRPWLENRP